MSRPLTREPNTSTLPLPLRRLILEAQKRQPLTEAGDVDENPEQFPFLTDGGRYDR